MRNLAAAGVDSEGAIHAASHCLVKFLCEQLQCEYSDLGTEHRSPKAARYRPPVFVRVLLEVILIFRLIVYGRNGIGTKGVMDEAWHGVIDIMKRAIQVLQGCSCQNGCPKCKRQ
jgi:ATP-dependent helicase YprA (DUF1998 family)